MPGLRSTLSPVIAKDNSASHGGRVRDFSNRYELSIDQVIDFSSNISPIGPPAGVRHALVDKMARIDRYPDDGDAARKAVADYVNTEPRNVLLGSGSVHLIYLLVNHFRPTRVKIFSPTFSEYERAAISAGADVTHIPYGSDFSLNIDNNRDELRDADMIFICNPNNPTGSLVDTKEILALKTIATRANIVVDEAFMDFLDDDLSAIGQATTDPEVIVLRSLGKFFSLAGLRIGYLVAEQSVIAELSRKNPPWMVSDMASAATVAALLDREFISVSKKEIASLRDDFLEDLQGIRGIHAFPSMVNFFLIKTTETGWDSRKIQKRLAKDAILIREVEDFVYLDNTHFRIAIKRSEDNKLLADALTGALR